MMYVGSSSQLLRCQGKVGRTRALCSSALLAARQSDAVNQGRAASRQQGQMTSYQPLMVEKVTSVTRYQYLKKKLCRRGRQQK
jgi:hypothetical protein